MTLEILNLSKKIGKKYLLKNINLHLEPGEIIGLLGPNGAGKSTSFYTILGISHLDEGQILMDGLDISKMPAFQRARKGLTYLPQESCLFKDLTLEENLIIALEERDQTRDKLERILQDFSLTALRNTKGAYLSGGEKRRLEIARALLLEPKYLFLDEPFAGVDPLAIEEIIKLLQKLAARGLGLLITDHNVKATLSIVTRAYIIYNGEILASGKRDEILADERVRKLYLGQEVF